MPLPEIEITEPVEVPELLQTTTEVLEPHVVLMALPLLQEVAEATIGTAHPPPEEVTILDGALGVISLGVQFQAETSAGLQADPVPEVTEAVVPPEAADLVVASAVQEAVPEEALELDPPVLPDPRAHPDQVEAEAEVEVEEAADHKLQQLLIRLI